ncbi:alpha/beta fold hydrolase [Streptomyces sp. NPDC005963]|uniref:thioesterase II family protein n=1 Tax=Streptomyces sp. NPDC005963 TaxID=3156721 RepID=UPI0033C9C79A
MQKAEGLELRLFVFHRSGGSHLMYRDWRSRFPAGWDVRTPDAPGLDPRDGRPALMAAVALVEHFLHELDPRLTGRFAFFGHSMGGIVVYEPIRRLVETGRTSPIWLGVSAHGTVRPEAARTGRRLLSEVTGRVRNDVCRALLTARASSAVPR